MMIELNKRTENDKGEPDKTTVDSQLEGLQYQELLGLLIPPRLLE